jgi:hypothetical protein
MNYTAKYDSVYLECSKSVSLSMRCTTLDMHESKFDFRNLVLSLTVPILRRRPWHLAYTGCPLYLYVMVRLPLLLFFRLLSWFNDTSTMRSRLAS